MKVFKLFVVTFFAAVLVTPLLLTRAVKSQSGPTEAPAAFDNQTNGFEPQGTPVPPGTLNVTPGNFEADKFIFSVVDEIPDGLGPVYNAQSCRECHQNPVTGGISQISELRAGHSRPDGTFVDAPGGSIINDRAIDAKIQERVPDGARILFQNGSHQIGVMGTDGGQSGAVGNSPVVGDYATFSPDGTTIIFHSAADAWVTPNPSNIFTMNSDGTNLQQLTTTNSDFTPVYSPDGTKIAFTSNRTGDFEIWVMNANGTSPVNVTNSSTTNDGIPSWSPDGTKLAYEGGPVSGPWNIYTINPNGTGKTQITSGATSEGHPTWSPDGTMIVYATNRDGTGTNHIYKVPATGGTPVRLTNTAAQDSNPAWSPDNSAIAFTRVSGSVNQIWTMAPDGSNPAQISGSASITHPAYSRDSGETIRTFRASLNLLGDGIVEAGGEATKNMIRTAPLWGVRTRTRLMHDAGGSSSAPTNNGTQSFAFNEAILRHAGQATSSRTTYQALSTVQKEQLIRFLKSL